MKNVYFSRSIYKLLLILTYFNLNYIGESFMKAIDDKIIIELDFVLPHSQYVSTRYDESYFSKLIINGNQVAHTELVPFSKIEEEFADYYNLFVDIDEQMFIAIGLKDLESNMFQHANWILHTKDFNILQNFEKAFQMSALNLGLNSKLYIVNEANSTMLEVYGINNFTIINKFSNALLYDTILSSGHRTNFNQQWIKMSFHPRFNFEGMNKTFYYDASEDASKTFPPATPPGGDLLLHSHIFNYCLQFLNMSVSTICPGKKPTTFDIVQIGEADFSIGLNILNASQATEFRFLHAVDYYKDEVYFSASARYQNTGLFVAVFQANVWATWAGLTIIFVIYFWVTSSGYMEFVFLALSVICQQGVDIEDLTKSFKTSFIFGLYVYFVYILFAFSFFNAVLINSLKFDFENIQTVNDLVRLGFSFTNETNLSFLSFLKQGKGVAKITRHDVYEEIEYIFEGVKTDEKRCEILAKIPMAGKSALTSGFTLRSSEYSNFLNLALIRMLETGVHFRNSKRLWRYKDDYAPRCPQAPPLRPLPFSAIQTVFWILSIGFISSVLVLLYEKRTDLRKISNCNSF